MKPLDQESALEVRYQNSIKILLDLALDNNHKRARVAASVLLSANRSLIRPNQEWLEGDLNEELKRFLYP